MSKAITFGERMGAPTRGFDYLRLGLAISIVAWHSMTVVLPRAPGAIDNVAAIDAAWASFRAPLTFLLPMFFTLSGFLVAGSLDRNRLDAFLALRVLRIGPALAVEVLLSALMLGPLLSSYSLKSYFTDSLFWSYLLNAIGDIHYKLPGVFSGNPRGDLVNSQLWTVPWELGCYLAITAVALLGLHRRRAMLLIVVLVLAIVIPLLDLKNTIHAGTSLSGPMLVVCFLIGVAVHAFRDRLPFSPILFAVCLVSAIALASHKILDVLCPLPLAYVTIWLGLQNPPKLPIVSCGDYSYGLYLFAFPIQQAAWQLGARTFAANLAITLALGFAYAAFSWRMVEAPILKRKSSLVRAVSNRIDALAQLRPKGSRTAPDRQSVM